MSADLLREIRDAQISAAEDVVVRNLERMGLAQKQTAAATNDQLAASHHDLLEAAKAIEHALMMGFAAGDVLHPASPIRTALKAAIAKAEAA